jgi:hypothetical protein
VYRNNCSANSAAPFGPCVYPLPSHLYNVRVASGALTGPLSCTRFRNLRVSAALADHLLASVAVRRLDFRRRAPASA